MVTIWTWPGLIIQMPMWSLLPTATRLGWLPPPCEWKQLTPI